MKNLPTMLVTPPTPMISTPPAITMPVPISYEFRVVEYLKEGIISKVRMEMRIIQHDQYGNMTIEGSWEEVPRIQVNV